MGTTAEVLEKLRGLDAPTTLALVDNFPGAREGVDAVLRGEKVIELRRLLVDSKGRCIPVKPEISAPMDNPNLDYKFGRAPVESFTPGLLWFTDGLKPGTDQQEFQRINDSLKTLVATVQANRPVANLLRGSCFPVYLPRVEFACQDYGAICQSLLELVEKAYVSSFAGRRVENRCKGQLVSNITIVDERYRKLLDDLITTGVVGVLCFPFQGWSVDAQRQMIGLLPGNMSLAGVIETSIAQLMYQEQFWRYDYVPVINCPAVNFEASGKTFSFHHSPDFQSLAFQESECGWEHPVPTGGLFIRA